jgi:RNA recognition motif-containing protein
MSTPRPTADRGVCPVEALPYNLQHLSRLILGYRQIRQGISNNTKGTAFVVYEDVMDAKQACDKLNGFNFQNRYLVGKLQSNQVLSSAAS